LLEEPLRSNPKFIYVLPNFQNPAGTTLSEDRRHELVLQADRYGIPILEDDPYGQLRYEGKHLPPLIALDRKNFRADSGYSHGNIIYLSTFSKTLAPGLRVGWIVAPPEIISKLTQLKQGADLHTSTFNQFVAYEVARDGFLEQHVQLIRRVYRERRDIMLQALKEFFPPEVTWTHPKGGLFLWVTLPEGSDMQAIFKSALEQNVAFVPGHSFFARSSPAIDNRGIGNDGRPADRHMRLNFSNAAPEQIREGIARLAAAVKSQLSSATRPSALPIQV
jgi:2-aminoadipate transaminase